MRHQKLLDDLYREISTRETSDPLRALLMNAYNALLELTRVYTVDEIEAERR